MKSSLPVPPGAAGQPDAVPAAAGTCRYPGCGHPARARAGDGPGAPPRYCGRTVAEDRGEHGTAEVTHTALTAFRRRQELAGADPGSGSNQPVTTAITRAAAIRDDVLAAITRLAAQLAAASPEAAEAQAEAVRAETAAGLEAARAELAGQAARAHAAQAETAEARTAAAQAITAMEAAQAARADAELRADAAAAAQAEAFGQAAQARADAEAAVTAAGQAAREQAAQAQAEAAAAVTTARAERDTALAAATAADARHQAARDQLTQLRDDHERHAAALAAAHQAQLGALEETITGLRSRLQRAEADADAGRAERQHLTDRLHELTARPDGARKTATA
jgi:chromosome segregation ATPase